MTITITLAQIRAHNPCTEGWRTLLQSLPKDFPHDQPFPLAHIVQSNGLDDALWCTRALPEHDRLWRLFAVWCARQVLQPDPRSVAAIDTAERFANGQATVEELTAASAAAWAAVSAADSAAAWAAASAADSDAAWAAASAADSDAASAAAWAAYSAAARDADSAAARDADSAAARDAAWAAAWAAARQQAREAQTAHFRSLILATYTP